MIKFKDCLVEKKDIKKLTLNQFLPYLKPVKENNIPTEVVYKVKGVEIKLRTLAKECFHLSFRTPEEQFYAHAASMWDGFTYYYNERDMEFIEKLLEDVIL